MGGREEGFRDGLDGAPEQKHGGRVHEPMCHDVQVIYRQLQAAHALPLMQLCSAMFMAACVVQHTEAMTAQHAMEWLLFGCVACRSWGALHLHDEMSLRLCLLQGGPYRPCIRACACDDGSQTSRLTLCVPKNSFKNPCFCLAGQVQAVEEADVQALRQTPRERSLAGPRASDQDEHGTPELRPPRRCAQGAATAVASSQRHLASQAQGARPPRRLQQRGRGDEARCLHLGDHLGAQTTSPAP